ncbi:MAG: DapH/DapD/GlmU-related protein [Pirellula sp.]|jgi:UDP-3-O-[3-hydroxymyristoyl] glucosamine N-acyltransferase
MAVLIIFGSRTALEVAEAAESCDSNSFDDVLVRFFAEPEFSDSIAPELESKYSKVYFHAGVADVAAKQEIVSACVARNWIPHSILHPTAVVSRDAKIGKGVFVGPLAVVSTQATVEDYAIIHIHASIGHDSIVGEYTSILPGARVSGNVRIGKRVLVGSNAFLNAGISIGDDSQIDALTYVARNLLPSMLCSVRIARPVPRLKKEQ